MMMKIHIAIYLLFLWGYTAHAQQNSKTDSAQVLEEVTVSTGLQQLPKERATGSFSHIDEAALSKQVSTDVLSRLEILAGGYVVDRNTNTGPRPLLRGVATLQGPTSPLIVIDNFPYDGDINNLNPNDIFDISILKDAAAASIWGARAANGVIVIRTKKGRLNQPAQISFNASAGMAGRPDLAYLPQMSAADFIAVEEQLYDAGYYNGQISNPNKPALTPAVELFIRRESASADEKSAIARQITALGTYDVRDDFSRYLYKPSLNQQYALSMQGGTTQMAWSALAGYDHNRDDLGAGYERLNLKLANTWQPLQALQLSNSLQYTQGTNSSGRPGYGDISFYNNLYPYARLADGSGMPLAMTKQYRQTYIDEVNAAGQLLDWSYYPLDDYRHVRRENDQPDLLVNSTAAYTLINGLQFQLNYQYERQQGSGRNLQGQGSFYTRNLINYYTTISEDGATERPIPLGDILDLDNSNLQSHQIRGQVNYQKQWQQHEVHALVGNEWRHSRTRTDSYRIYGYNDDILTFAYADYSRPVENYVSGSQVYIPNSNALNERTTRFVSFFANGSYTYNRRYTLSFSARRDASNLFGLNVNDQWNAFWSAGAAWEVSREPFFRWAALPFLKLRLTYGASGNIDPAMVAVTTMRYNAGPSAGTGMPWASFDNYYNPDLRWETTRMLNTGIDFATNNQRITGSMEYYHKSALDLFGDSEIDYTAGIGRTAIKNASALRGNGLDVSLVSKNLTGKFTWSSALNLSYYQNKVTKNLNMGSATGIVSGLGGSQGRNSIPGRPANAILGFRWGGLSAETGDPQGWIDGIISTNYSQLVGNTVKAEDLVYVGPSVPTWFGSLRNMFAYRDFSLELALGYQLGYYFRRPSVNYDELFYYGGNQHADYARRWQKPGDERHTPVPSMVYPNPYGRDLFYAGSEVLAERGDHVRLQYITLGYQFSRQSIPALPVRLLELYVNGSNLGLLWKANNYGIDPDYHNLSAFPSPARYSLGIRVHF